MTMNDFAGHDLHGYRLLKLAGRGAFATVFQARHPRTGEIVALKILRPVMLNDPEFALRFETEVDVIAELGQHPNILRLIEFWRNGDNAFLALQWLGGGSLKNRLEKLNGGLPLDEVVLYVRAIANATGYAHARGIVHRDLKPANILLSEAGHVYVADFGIAKRADVSITQSGHLVGSPAYLAPEQFLDAPITPQTDIYSLGILIYELLVGKHPFDGMSAAHIMMRQLKTPLPQARQHRPELPAEVDAIIQKATAKAPEDRYETANALSQALRRAASAT